MAAGVPTTRLGRCCRYCGIAVSFLISQFGLCALVLAYAFGGAFMFHYLESPHEQQVGNETRAKRQQFLSVLWLLAENKTALVYDDWFVTAHNELVTFENDIIRAVKDNGYNGSEAEGEDLQWSVAGAMMYSIIVITTIGYGNLAPKTTVGRIATMIYAIAGIPLLRLFLSEIGDFLADTFKFLYWKVCYRMCIKEKHRIRHQNRRQQSHRRFEEGPSFNSLPMTPINQCSPVLSRTSSNASIECPAMPYIDDIDASRVPVISNKYALQSEQQTGGRGSSMNGRISQNQRTRGRPALPPLDLTRVPMNRTVAVSPDPPQVALLREPMNRWESDSDSTIDTEEKVPIVLCMALVLGYICFGAWLFRQWEVGWSFLDSAYFCFVTLTTIGFGDIVPKAVLEPDRNEGRTTLVVCAVYLLFGMALLAMSFTMMQEAVSKSIKSTVRKSNARDGVEPLFPSAAVLVVVSRGEQHMQCYDAMSCLRFTVRKLSSFPAVPLQFVRIPGIRSNDAPVLFLHGLFGNKNNWRSIARRVTDECGRTTFCVDLRNHGDSPHTDPDSSVTIAMAEDVKDLLFRERIDRSILVGHSMGGRVALQLAYLHAPLLEKVIAVDVSPVSIPSSMDSMKAYIDAMNRVVREVSPANGLALARREADQILESVIPEKLVRDFLMMNLVRDDDGQLKWKFNLEAMRQLLVAGRLREVHFDPANPCDVPAVFIFGQESDFVQESDHPQILRRFPNSTFHGIEDAGHYLHVEKQSQFLNVLYEHVK